MTYRVNISEIAQLRKPDDTIHSVNVKDVSLTGFSILDKKNELQLSREDGVTIQFVDINHTIDEHFLCFILVIHVFYTCSGFWFVEINIVYKQVASFWCRQEELHLEDITPIDCISFVYTQRNIT